MPLVTDRRGSRPEVASAASPDPAGGVSSDARGPARADAIDRADGGDPSGDADDIAAWYPVFLATFLLGLLEFDGLWAANFVISAREDIVRPLRSRATWFGIYPPANL